MTGRLSVRARNVLIREGLDLMDIPGTKRKVREALDLGVHWRHCGPQTVEELSRWAAEPERGGERQEMNVRLVLDEEPVWAARFACLVAMMNGVEMSTASRAMVRELFECIQDNLPDDLGVEIVVTRDGGESKQ